MAFRALTPTSESAPYAIRPRRHSPVRRLWPPPLEQVRPRISRLGLVPDHMRKCRLDDFAWVVRLLGRPVPEARPEAVRHGRDLVVL